MLAIIQPFIYFLAESASSNLRGPPGSNSNKPFRGATATSSGHMSTFDPYNENSYKKSSTSSSQNDVLLDPALPKGPPKTIQNIVPQVKKVLWADYCSGSISG